MEDWLSSMAERGLILSAADCPRLGANYRLRAGDTAESRWLVNGESTVLLNDTATEIMVRCDGQHSVTQLVQELQTVYQGTAEEDIVSGVQAFLEMALEKGWIELGSR